MTYQPPPSPSRLPPRGLIVHVLESLPVPVLNLTPLEYLISTGVHEQLKLLPDEEWEEFLERQQRRER